MAEKPRIVGIDLGTTNTLVASVRNRIPKVVPTDRGNLVLPSVVALSEKGDLLVVGADYSLETGVVEFLDGDPAGKAS